MMNICSKKSALVLLAISSVLLVGISFLLTDKIKHLYSVLSPSYETEDMGLHIVTNYQIMTESPWKESQTTNNLSLLHERQLELEEVIQRNLDNPLVAKVHLLVNQNSAKTRMENLPLRNKKKIVVYGVDTMPKFRHRYEYISKNLLNHVVVDLQGDIYLGEGFDKINKTFLVEENVCYAPTRHGKKELRCDMSGRRGYCGLGYIGSHDSFIMVFTKPINESVLQEMDFYANAMGAENVLIWILKNRLHMRFLNPCKELKVYHLHCIGIHGNSRPRINNQKSGVVQESGMYFNKMN